VLQARIDALTPEQKSVLHRAAVIGRRFWDQAVAALGDTPTGNGEVAGSLTELRTRELIYGRESSSIADAAEFAFKHAVLRDVAYQSVLRRYRSGYHSRAAAWLTSVAEATDRADEFAALIAEHHDAAGEPGAAATWFLRAGSAAAARFANAEALAMLSRADTLAPADAAEFRYQLAEATQGIHGRIGDRVAESDDLDILTALADVLDDDRRRVDVELLRATQASDVGKPVEAETHARAAAGTARRLRDTEREARALLVLGTALWRRGAPAEAVPVLTEALEIARGYGDDALAAGCLRNRGVAQQYLGRFDEAEADYREAATLWRRAGDRNGVSQVFNSLGILAYDRENFDAARSFFDQALVTKRAMGDRLGENRVLNNLALVAVALHDHDLAVDSFERTLALAREIDDLDGEAASHQGLGYTALRVGRLEPARHHLTESRRLFAEEGDQQGECQVVHLLAEVAHAAGQPDLARTLADEAGAAASSAGLPTEEAAVHNLLGRLAADAGRFEEAEAAYRRSLELHGELGSTRRVNEVRAGLAEVLQALGRTAEARTLVAAVGEHFREHGGAGIDQPVATLLSCLRVLREQRDPAAARVIELAHSHIDQIAATIADPEIRRSYREDVAANRLMLAEPYPEAGVSRPDR
ncbi:MAG: tetratricopeptide repeat protein, partial [Actinomycetota bacterium]|nr:tetratricopeptide repeat protein [Actinomycetota bacterium]